MSFKMQQCFWVVFVGCLAQSAWEGTFRYCAIIIPNQPNHSWLSIGGGSFVHDLECTGVAKPWNAIQEDRGVGINLLGLAFSWGNGKFLLPEETFYQTKDPTSAFIPVSSSIFRRVTSWRWESLHVKHPHWRSDRIGSSNWVKVTKQT